MSHLEGTSPQKGLFPVQALISLSGRSFIVCGSLWPLDQPSGIFFIFHYPL